MASQVRESDTSTLNFSQRLSSLSRKIGRRGIWMPSNASIILPSTRAIPLIESRNKPVTGSPKNLILDCFMLGKSMYITKNLLAMVRGITTGGSSLYYCALAVDPPVEMLKKHGVDVTKEVEEIKSAVPCAPLRDDLMSQAGKVFMESALDLGYDCKKMNKYIYGEWFPSTGYERDEMKPDIAAYFPVAFMSTKGMGVRWWIPVIKKN